MEKLENKNESKNIEISEKEKHKADGLKRLMEAGINPEDYKEYFEIMRMDDIPLKQALPDLNLVKEEILSISEIYEMWKVVKKIYDKIDMSKQTEKTGKNILEKMKVLVDRYDLLLKDWIKKGTLEPDKELIIIRENMLTLANEYNNLPAYLSYRLYGIYDVDKDLISKDEYFRDRLDQNS